MRCAIIENGVVTNIAEADADFAAEQGWVEAAVGVAVGWTHDGEDFAAPVIPLDDAKAAKKVAIKAHQAVLFAAGWTHDFGAPGVHTLDLRGADDKGNWTLLLIKTQGMIAAGGGAMPVRIRTAANATIEVTATIANAAMVQFLAWGEAMLSNKWDLDEAVDAAATTNDVDGIDETAGWP